MPCFDCGCPNDVVISREEFNESKKISATLCGILSTMNDDQINKLWEKVDWTEIGVSPKWAATSWRKYKEEDEIRRKKEMGIKNREEMRKKALAKLSNRDKILLGLED